MPGGRSSWRGWLFIVGTLLLLTGPGLITHVSAATDFYRLNDDARQQIFPFLRYVDSHLFRDDATADYFLACFPLGYKTLYIAAAQIGDPRTFSKWLPYVLLIAMCASAAWAAGRLQGRWAAWATIGFCLGVTVFAGRLAGGLPRSFAFPLYALLAAALVTGRPMIAAAVVVAGAAFYPTVAVAGGISLAILLLVCPATWRGDAREWSLVRRTVFLALTALIVVVSTLPVQRAAAPWGPVLRPADAADYPELGPGGRYSNEDLRTGFFNSQNLRNFLYAPLAGVGGPWESGAPLFGRPERGIPVALLAIAGLVGFAALCRRSPAALRLLCLPAAAIIANAVSIPLAPYLYLPARYQIYPLAIFAVIAIPVGVAELPRLIQPSTATLARRRLVTVLGCGIPLILLAGPRISLKHKIEPGGMGVSGLSRQVSTQHATYELIAALPPTALVAGWPDDLDNVPYLTSRRVLLSHELHQVFHKKYADLMRARAEAVIDAEFDPSPASLVRLRDEFHATHFLIDRSRFGRKDGFAYFPPFDARIQSARQKWNRESAALWQPHAVVSRDGDWLLLDLSKLRDGTEQTRSDRMPDRNEP